MSLSQNLYVGQGWHCQHFLIPENKNITKKDASLCSAFLRVVDGESAPEPLPIRRPQPLPAAQHQPRRGRPGQQRPQDGIGGAACSRAQQPRPSRERLTRSLQGTFFFLKQKMFAFCLIVAGMVYPRLKSTNCWSLKCSFFIFIGGGFFLGT